MKARLINFRSTDTFYDKFTENAQALNMNNSQFITFCINKYIEEYEKKKRNH